MNIIAFFLLSTAPFISAKCTILTNPTYNNNTGDPINIAGLPVNATAVLLGWFSCPETNATCSIPTYTTPDQHFTTPIPARLNISTSPSDTESIIALAAASYNTHFNATSSNTSGFNINGPDAVIYYANATTLTKNIGPGQNGTLRWVPQMKYISGTLSGCSNTSLEGVTITAAAPKLEQSTGNVEGSFTLDIQKLKASGAGRTAVGLGFGGGVVGLLAFIGAVVMELSG